MSPVIILGGIYGGVFTPTEAAAISIFYGLFVGVFIYHSITWKVLYDLLSFSAITSAVVMILIGMGGLYSWAAQTVGLIDKVAGLLLSVSDNPNVVLVIINVILLIAGMLIGGNSIFYIFIPLFIPVVSHFGWDPIWFGVMCTVNIAIGQITPPVGQPVLGMTSADNYGTADPEGHAAGSGLSCCFGHCCSIPESHSFPSETLGAHVRPGRDEPISRLVFSPHDNLNKFQRSCPIQWQERSLFSLPVIEK